MLLVVLGGWQVLASPGLGSGQLVLAEVGGWLMCARLDFVAFAVRWFEMRMQLLTVAAGPVEMLSAVVG